MRNCVRCPVPNGCGNKPCRHSAYQPKTERPMTTRQQVLRCRMQQRPVDLNEPPGVTSWWWGQIMQAYAHLCDRANAWDHSAPVQASLPVEDTLPPAVAERVERVADGYRRLQADVQAVGYSGYHPSLPPAPSKSVAPPIVHPAGVIPREVEQAMTHQFQNRELAETMAAFVTTAKTSAEHALNGLRDADLGRFFQQPTVDSAPAPGWLARWKARLFGGDHA